MARRKKEVKAKEPVRIRFKQLANGNKSIYLDTYKGKDKNGKIIREYEYLKLYIVPEVDATSKQLNESALQSAETIKAQRVIDINDAKAGVPNKSKGKIRLSDWLQRYYEHKKDTCSKARQESCATAIKTITAFGNDAMLKDIDKKWLNEFIRFLNDAEKANGGKFKGISKKRYYDVLNNALSFAVEEEIIINNPCRLIREVAKQFHVEEAKVAYLEENEVNALINTPCGNEQVKRAYLFSCFSGLRLGDVEALTWGNIKGNEIHIKMQKTKRDLSVPLVDAALSFLPERGDKADGDRVFTLPSRYCIKYHLERWAKAAGIDKNLTYHTSRHTFATTLITAGADLYTTSKLMGHTKIDVTQRYADIVNKKKQDAMSKLNAMFNK